MTENKFDLTIYGEPATEQPPHRACHRADPHRRRYYRRYHHRHPRPGHAAEKLSRRRLLCHHRQGREISSPGVRGRIRP